MTNETEKPVQIEDKEDLIRKLYAESELTSLLQAVGRELQGIPKRYRTLTISRLRNKAQTLRTIEDFSRYSILIDAMCDGWEDFSPRE